MIFLSASIYVDFGINKNELIFTNTSIDTPQVVEYFPVLNTGLLGTHITTTIPIAASGPITITFPKDGLYVIGVVGDAINRKTFIVANTVYTSIKSKVHDMILVNDTKSNPQSSYDFVSLVILSILFVGNPTYQLKAYNVANVLDYSNLQLAFTQCNKYIDVNLNTFQSTTEIWK